MDPKHEDEKMKERRKKISKQTNKQIILEHKNSEIGPL